MIHPQQWDKILRRGILLSIVLGLIVYSVAPSAAAPPMLSCQLSSSYNLMPRVVMPGKPDTGPIFSVVGKCTFPTRGFSIELKPHTPSSPDPKILLLDAIVHAPVNPGPQVRTDVPVRYELRTTPTMYEKVVILPDHLVVTVGKAY